MIPKNSRFDLSRLYQKQIHADKLINDCQVLNILLSTNQGP